MARKNSNATSRTTWAPEAIIAELTSGEWTRHKIGDALERGRKISGERLKDMYSKRQALKFRTIGNRYVVSLSDGWAEKPVPGKTP